MQNTDLCDNLMDENIERHATELVHCLHCDFESLPQHFQRLVVGEMVISTEPIEIVVLASVRGAQMKDLLNSHSTRYQTQTDTAC